MLSHENFRAREHGLLKQLALLNPSPVSSGPMAQTVEEAARQSVSFRPSSSIREDAWHGAHPTPAYEWWYFDALSPDGRDAFVVIFLSNFIFSPRYNRSASESLRQSGSPQSSTTVPAVAACFYRDGRPLFRSINEYSHDDFQAGTTKPECRIGQSSFRFVDDETKPRYELTIETHLRRDRILRARLSWTIEEGDLFEAEKENVSDNAAHNWNMVAPRCDVSGEIVLTERSGKRFFEHDFHGVGYHDHNWDARWMPATISEWQWGRVHFPKATAVFYSYRERNETKPVTRLYLIQDDSLSVFTPQLKMSRTRRHFFGLRYPRLLQFQATSENYHASLEVRQQRVIDGSFFYLRFLSEATLETIGGRTSLATCITEQLNPHTLSRTWLRWLINMRIGRNGRGAFLP
jgi:carotenoid 1,2-hydratase